LESQPPTFVPRPYQLGAVEQVRELVRQGKRRIIIQADTGAGKTLIAALLMQLTTQKGNRSLFLAGARELIYQASDKLDLCGVPHGLIMAGHGYSYSQAVQLASKDTVCARAIRNNKIELPDAQLVITDECHLSGAAGWQKLLSEYPGAVIIGLTATPVGAKGRGLGPFYQDIVRVATREELISGKYLVATDVYAPHIPNLKPKKGEKAIAANGDYRSDFLERRLDRPSLIGDIVYHWKKLAQDRPTLFFGSSVGHSIHVMEEFRKAGISAEHIDAQSDDAFRRELLGSYAAPGKFASGEVRVLCNYGILVQGVDQPCAGVIIMGRPTKSLVVYRQAVGRMVRPYSGPLYVKERALLLDHAGVVYHHGMPDEDIPWSLDDNRSIEEKVQKERDDGTRSKPVICPKCYATFTGTNVCPQCGHIIETKQRAEPVVKKDGVLVKVTQDDIKNLTPDRHAQLVKLWHKCLGVASARDLTPLHAAYHFRRECGQAPGTIPGMPNVPTTHAAWNMKVRQLYPNYGHGRMRIS
jgi:DNA repair protein RadD